MHRQCGNDRLGRGRAHGAGLTDELDAPARARWPLDDSAEKVRGAGVKAMNIGVIGGGAWGTALAQVVASGGRDTLLWALEPDVVEAVNAAPRKPASICQAWRSIPRSAPPRISPSFTPATPGWW